MEEKRKIANDRYNKYKEIKAIASIIEKCSKGTAPMSFSIEGEWGIGKSWMLDRIEAELNGADLSKPLSEIKSTLTSQYLIIRYNAWERDYCDEPLLGIVSSIVNQLNEVLQHKQLLKGILKKLARDTLNVLEKSLASLSTRLFGTNLVEIGKAVAEAFDNINKESKIQLSSPNAYSTIETDVNTIVCELKKIADKIPIVFFVDELDRCIPSYAIKTLERLHHVFGKIPHTVTVISIYRKQLDNSIKHMFGEDISTQDYLRKFIDFTVATGNGTLDVGETMVFLDDFASFFSQPQKNDKKAVILEDLQRNMSPRDFETICKRAHLCHSLVQQSSKSFPFECFYAELLLHAYKFAMEKEDEIHKPSLSPLTVSFPKEQLGQYLKHYLSNLKNNLRNKIVNPSSQNSNTVYFFESDALILFIFNEIWGFEMSWECEMGHSSLMDSLREYYNEYFLLYHAIK